MKKDDEYLNEKRERSQQIADKYRRNAARRAGKTVASTQLPGRAGASGRSSSGRSSSGGGSASSARGASADRGASAARRASAARGTASSRRSGARPASGRKRSRGAAISFADILGDPRVRIAAVILAALLAIFVISRLFAGVGRKKPIEPETTTTEYDTTEEETTEEETEPPLGSFYETGKPAVALTFDDGPEVDSTNQILDILEQYHVHATFFYVGKNIEVNPAAVKRAAELGCELGNHTWSHTKMTTMTSEQRAEDFKKTNHAIEEASGGVPVTVLRPPYGSSDKEVRDEVDIPVVIWSLDTLDWKTRDADSTVQTIREEVKGGDIILMHDIHQPTAEAVKEVVPMLLEQGYKLLTVTELYEYYKEPLTLHVGHSYAEIQENPDGVPSDGASSQEGQISDGGSAEGAGDAGGDDAAAEVNDGEGGDEAGDDAGGDDGAQAEGGGA